MSIERILTAGLFFIAAFGLFVGGAQAQDDDALRLKPSSKWVMHHADDSCRLMRIFGEGKNKVAFYIERYEPGDYFVMLAAGRPFKSVSRSEHAFVRFGETHQETRLNFAPGSLADYEPAMIFQSTWFDARSVDGKPARKPGDRRDIFSQTYAPEAETAIDWISIRRPRKEAVVLETGSMGSPMEAMRHCTDQLLTGWGIDLEKHRNLAQAVKPTGSPGDWVRASDYPSQLLRAGQQGIVRFRLSVGADGVPTDCHIQQSTRPEGFDRAVCAALMRKARFEPARTKSSEAIASYWRSTVRFAIRR